MPATGRERVAAGVLVGAATLFVGFAIPRMAVRGFFGALTLPLVLLVADLVIAAAVVTWWYPIRPAAQGLAVFGILVHALVMLRGGPIWTRGCSGVLLLVHSWALLQLFLMTSSEDDESDDESDDSPDESPDPKPDLEPDLEPDRRPHQDASDDDRSRVAAPYELADLVGTPVTEVVDVAVPPEPDGLEGPAPTAARTGSTAAEKSDGEPEHEHEERIR